MTETLVLVMLYINPVTGLITARVTPMPAAECLLELEEIRAEAKNTTAMAWCAPPGAVTQITPNRSGS